MSSRILLQPDRFDLRPLAPSPRPEDANLNYSLGFIFEQYGQWQVRFPTYVPREFVALFDEGRVVEAHVETLDHNGTAQRLLPDGPQYAVLGVVLVDGTAFSAIPEAFTAARRRKVALSLGMMGAAAVLLAAGSFPVVAGALLGLAVQPLRTASEIPAKAVFSTRRQKTVRL